MSLSCVDGNEVDGGPQYLSYYTRLKKVISPSLSSALLFSFKFSHCKTTTRQEKRRENVEKNKNSSNSHIRLLYVYVVHAYPI